MSRRTDETSSSRASTKVLLAKTSGRRGVPKYKARSGARAEVLKDGNMALSQDELDGFWTVDHDKKEAVMSLERQPYRPLAILKCLTKCAYAVCPEQDLAEIEGTRTWLLSEDVDRREKSASIIPYLIEFKSGGVFNRPFSILFKKTSNINAPFLSLLIGAGLTTYQIFLTSEEQRSRIFTGRAIIVPFPPPAPPHTRHESPRTLKGRMEDMSSPERCVGSVYQASFSYGNRVKI